MEARKVVVSEVEACSRGRVARKIQAVEAAIFDDRQPSLRETARAFRIPSSTLHDLIGRVKARLATRIECSHASRKLQRS